MARLQTALGDRYTIERELGRGGMATVFLAQDRKHHRQVAIKVLLPELAAALGADRFLREIEIAAKLTHPHILPVYDSGEAGGFLCYVMPYVEGESLRDRLGREQQLPVEDALQVVQEVADALAYAHAHDVVHRDIKPENILLEAGHAVVSDFGIARAITAAGGERLTATGIAVGTPVYMSPEQGAGHPDIDGRSDQYSLACVVYEMLVGQPPFTGRTPQAIMARHSLDHVSPPSIVRDAIPATMEAAILRGLAKTPADRFPTMSAFAAALRSPSSITAARRRHSTAPALARRFERWRLPRWALPVTVAILAGGAWLGRGLWHGRGGGAANGPDPRRIAVLYFDDRSPGKTLGYFADGLTEALIYELSQVTSLQVISRNGVAPYRDSKTSTDSIARALKVGTVVEGTVAQSGSRLRVTVDMINTADGSVMSSGPIDRVREDVFGLQDELARSVSEFLRRRLGQVVHQVETRAGTSDATAWELVMRAEAATKGVDSLLVSADTAAAARALARADSLLARAAGMDRKWVVPIVKRGWVAYDQRQLVRWEKGPASEWIHRGLEFADQALKLQPNDPEALRLRGTLRYMRWLLGLDPYPLTSDQLLDSAEANLRASADSTNPNRASAWSLLSHLLQRKSEPAEGKLAALRAYEADPYVSDANEVVYRLFTSSLDLEDGAGADRWCQEGRRRFPNDPYFTECQIELMALPGQQVDVQRAWRILEADVSLYPPNQRDWRRRRDQLLVALVLANAGLRDSAGSVAIRSRADGSVDPTRELVYTEAMLRNLLGDRDESLRLLSLYLATNPNDRLALANDQSWWWRGVHEDARFKALVGSSTTR